MNRRSRGFIPEGYVSDSDPSVLIESKLLKNKPELVREAAKKLFFLVTGPLRGDGG